MQIGIIGKALHFGPCRVILTSLNILLLLMASYLFRPIADCAPIINIDGDVAESGDGLVVFGFIQEGVLMLASMLLYFVGYSLSEGGVRAAAATTRHRQPRVPCFIWSAAMAVRLAVCHCKLCCLSCTRPRPACFELH